MSALVPVRTVGTVTRMVDFLLSSGYMEIPGEYLDEDEVQEQLQHILVDQSQHAVTEIQLEQVIDLCDLTQKLDVIERVEGDNWDTLMGSLTMACSEHPAACVVVTGKQAMCIVGFDGNSTGDESRYVSMISDARQNTTPHVDTVDSEYDLRLPHIPEGSYYNALIVQSKRFSLSKTPPKKKARVASQKGKEEEEEDDMQEEELVVVKKEKEAPIPHPSLEGLSEEQEEEEEEVVRKRVPPAKPQQQKRKRSTRSRKNGMDVMWVTAGDDRTDLPSWDRKWISRADTPPSETFSRWNRIYVDWQPDRDGISTISPEIVITVWALSVGADKNDPEWRKDFWTSASNPACLIYISEDRSAPALLSTLYKKFVEKNSTTRGTGADVIIIDEAAHIDPQLFYQTILPILQMKNTALLCLSSPEGDENYYSQLLNLQDPLTNGPFFRVVECFMICKDCQKLEREEAIKCDHVPQTAHWLSKKKSQRLKLLYKTSPALAMREFGGMVVSDYLPAFKKEEIAYMFNPERKHITTHAPKFIFTSADPNGGGPSHMAICSAYYYSGSLVIIGLDSEGVKHSQEEFNLLRRHFKRMRENKHWKAARKIFIPENNLGLEASHLHTMVQQYNDVQTYWETPKKPGICKTHQKTIDYTMLLNSMLFDKTVTLDQDLFTISKEQTQESITNLLREQIERFHWEKKAATDNFGKDRWAITGKMGNDKQDDLLITLFMCAFFGRGITLDPGRLDV